jgi:hypothetical protein
MSVSSLSRLVGLNAIRHLPRRQAFLAAQFHIGNSQKTTLGSKPINKTAYVTRLTPRSIPIPSGFELSNVKDR